MKILISQKEYYEKLLQVAQHIMPAIIRNEPHTDLKKDVNRETFSYMSVSIAKAILREIGYEPNRSSNSISRSGVDKDIEFENITDKNKEGPALTTSLSEMINDATPDKLDKGDTSVFKDEETGATLKIAPYKKR
jgi:predicted hydrolase (HD superfamily)